MKLIESFSIRHSFAGAWIVERMFKHQLLSIAAVMDMVGRFVEYE